MTKGQFLLMTAALGVLTMGGAGYIAYANTSPSPSQPGSTSNTGAASGGQQGGGNGGTVQLQTGGTGTKGSTSADPACVNGDVDVTDTPGQGAAGTLSLVLIFHNVSGHRCYLTGYPGASVVGPGGEDLLDATRDHADAAKVSDVTLAVDGRASALLQWSDVPGSAGADGCAVQNAANLMVTPPNFTQSSTLSISASTGSEICSGFEIHPVVKGLAGL
jgi:hypothetical protein